MTIHEEFLQILQILSEDPNPSPRKPPEAARPKDSRDLSSDCGSKDCKGAAS